MKSPEELVNKVTDESSFLIFAKALLADRRATDEKEKKEESSPYGPDSGGWENTTIADYLDGGIAWAEDSKFGTEMAFPEYEIKEENPWRRFAAFLMAAKVYE